MKLSSIQNKKRKTTIIKATWGQGLHTLMTFTFFLSLILVFLVGRRAVCSWNCSCVGTRDTMGAAFRKEMIKTETALTPFSHY